MMIPGTVLDWLEAMDYDVTMLRVQSSASGKSNAPSSEPAVPSLADYLQMLDQRHPYLAHLTQPGPSVVQFIDTEHRCFELVHQEGKVYAVARSLGVLQPHRLSVAHAVEPLDLNELPAEDYEEHRYAGRIFVAASVQEVRRKVDRASCPPRCRFFSKLYRLAAGRFPSFNAS